MPVLPEYRKIDGSENNVFEPGWGQAFTALRRVAPNEYADSVSAPGGVGLPSPRLVSNEIFNQPADMPNAAGASNFLWLWGQFVDHDLDFVKLQSGAGAEIVTFPVPTGDPFFDPFSTGTVTMKITRDEAHPGTGTGAGNPREHTNTLTHWLDASMVYGSDAAREAALRDAGGKLKVSAGDLLPLNTLGLPNGNLPAGGPPAETLFIAGDVRANENPALAMMHTIFVREHNRLVDELAAANPAWDAETLYQEAKARVEAEIQAITYNEWLPVLLGIEALPDFAGYQDDVNPAIDQVFAAALFRLGHTLLSHQIQRLDEGGAAIPAGHLALSDVFFNIDSVKAANGIDDLVRGLGATKAQELDAKVIDDVRNLLFGPPGAGGMDLVAINIMRGREHGLPDYNAARLAYGLAPVADFDDITSNPALAAKLEALYGTVDTIDLFVGALAEDDAPGAMVGALLRAVLVDQFARLRDGDRFWYENRVGGEELAKLEATTLSDVLLRTTGIEHLQHDIFYAYDRIGGSDNWDWLSGDGGRDLIWGRKGNDHLEGWGGADQLHGDAGRDRLSGGEGDDHLYGGDGNDQMFGGAGKDYADGGAGNDEIKGGSSADKLWGGAGNDQIWGENGDDKLWGGANNDRLFGGYGNDCLAGGPGNDRLTGGHGADKFAVGEGHDIIEDFQPFGSLHDFIDLRGTGLDFSDVNFQQLGDDARLTFDGSAASVTLRGVEVGDLSEAMFLVA
jgi:peroxidase